MPTSPAKDPLLVRAARGEIVERVPVWLMRQAGRYLDEYRELRSRHGFLEVVKNPELAAEVSLQPWRAFRPDGVIFFSDILTPLEGMGIPFRLDEGGPRITEPVRSKADLQRVRVADPAESTPYVLDLVRLLRRELGGEVPVLGFAGAPWTLATYCVGDGRHAKESPVKTLAYEDPGTLHALLDKLTEQAILYLVAQAEAGAAVVQLFDTWAGELSERDYREFALPYQQRIFAALKGKVPTILYVLGGSAFVPLLSQSGADILSIDWRIPLARARELVEREVVLQGNLDPAVLYGPIDVVRERTIEILEELGGLRHIFNVGHGLLPGSRRENVAALIETVKRWGPIE